ncbi:MAG TPA: hypothetical protein VIY52_02230 [Streptosporangiaceae bacterium]
MTVWQFTRFRFRPGREPEVLSARDASLRPCWTSQPELRAAYLVELAEGEWLDITVWAGQSGDVVVSQADRDGTAGPVDLARPASRAFFFAQIDELIGEECGIVVREDAQRERK